MNSKIEEKYRELVQNANSIILRMDVKGNITFFNEFAQNFFGYREEKILGKNVIGTIVPLTDTSGQDLKAMIDNIMANPKKYINNENENMLRDGKRVWISWTNKPIIDKNGRLEEVLSIGNDITRLKQAEMELLKAKELAEAASRAGTIVCGTDWKIREINATARKYFSVEDSLGNNEDFLQIITKSYTTSISKSEIADLSRIRKTFDLVRPETEKNKPLYLQVNMEVLKNQLHEISSIVMILQDVTEMRVEESVKRDFLSLISYKLRTPVTGVTQDVTMLQAGAMGELSSQQKNVVEKIAKQSYKIMGYVEKLLGFVTIEKDKLELPPETIELKIYLPMLIEPMFRIAKGKKVEFTIDCPEDASLSMNKVYFDLIIGNLVENAIKFNDKENIELHVNVNKTRQEIFIAIGDNGAGIPPEDIEKIFDKFYQIDKRFTGDTEGVGLGLAIVKRLVKMHNGRITVKSKMGEGAEFTIILPVV